MPAGKIELLRYDPSAALVETTGIAPAELLALAPRLEAARCAVLEDFQRSHQGEPALGDTNPLDAGFIDFPERILRQYRQGAGDQPAGAHLTHRQAAARSRRSRSDPRQR